jgi:iron complex outermembrane receptor protein
MKNLLFILVFTIVSTVVAVGQFRVDGKVLTADGDVLSGARVHFDGKTLASDSDGNFVFEDVSAGKHQLQVSFVGYESYSKDLVIKSNFNTEIMLQETSIMTGEITVAAVRANRNDPVAFSEVSREEIEKNNFGQDIPYLLNMTPGLVVGSDAGGGVGYTSMRLRGSDLTRINVTVNGIPLNDAESQGVYWVNMPDFASSVDNVQVQRGVGTSTNGAASFGGSINFSTLSKPDKSHVVVDNSYGSFNTMRNSVQVQSGLLKDHFAFDVRLSKIASDGFIDRGASDLKSFYLSGGYFTDKTTLRFVTFSGAEKTYQAWNGVPKVKLENDLDGMAKLIENDGWSVEESENLYSSNARTFNRYLYKNQTDNYQQHHYQIHFSQRFSPRFVFNTALHYTRGKGYYESYKYDQKFTKYDFPFESVVVDGETITRTDLIAQKWLDNGFYGVTGSGIYKSGPITLVVGGAYNRYDGDHYGNVIWSALDLGLAENHQWYFNDGRKTDLNYFAKTTVDVTDKISIYGDVQARHISYEISGLHDDLTNLSRSTKFNFINPKFGLNYSIKPGSRVYASVAKANKEPSRSDFRDADADNTPTTEKLIDWEAGVEWTERNWAVQLNGFYMDYEDQLVLTGKINNVGAPIMMNVPKSYRMGIEFSAQAQIIPEIKWGGNVVLSENKIMNFVEYVDDWDTYLQQATYLGTTDIAFSPKLTIASRLEIQPITNLTTSINSRYVGKQFIDNTSNSARRLDDYLVNDFIVRYSIQTKKGLVIELGAQVNNLLDENYIANAWVYSYIYGNDRDVLDGYYPQAGRHYMGQVVLKF